MTTYQEISIIASQPSPPKMPNLFKKPRFPTAVLKQNRGVCSSPSNFRLQLKLNALSREMVPIIGHTF